MNRHSKLAIDHCWVGGSWSSPVEARIAHFVRFETILEPGAGGELRSAYSLGNEQHARARALPRRRELRWLVCAVDAPYWPDAERAGADLLHACLRRAAGAREFREDFGLPAPGVYGVPEQWPHVARLLTDAGFGPGDRAEWVYLADTASLADFDAAPDLSWDRRLGINGTRLTASRDGAPVGYIEVASRNGDLGLTGQFGGLADVGNLWLSDPSDDPLVRQLFRAAGDWLRLGRVERLLGYTDETDEQDQRRYTANEFAPLTRTVRGRRHDPA